MGSSPLGQPYDHAIACLAAAGGDIASLPVPLQTLLLIESAQGIVDNGGLAFFYEADFPNNPPYSDFVAAYRRIGAEAAASCIEQSAALFPFEEPHLFEELRQIWLERIGGELALLDAAMAGDASVWSKLADYVEQHRAAFT
ncbi:MAG TPA: DUF4375 domain-containing protein [Ramlibacter sp.]|jgi:hypothetical protein|nr:DUF4375 domain-containing protein [Ramlibacter sp.]